MSTNQRIQRIHLSQQDNLTKFSRSITNREESSNYCKMCQKNEYHCERCRRRCHKKCQGHTHRHIKNWTKRSSSFNRIRTAYNGRTSQTNKCKPTGDEHWTKVLQANDFCFTSCPRHCSSLVSSPRSATDREFGSIFLSFSHSTVAHSNSSSVSRASSFASRQKSPQSLSPQSPIAPNGVKEQFQVNSKEKNVFHSLYSRFINWIESNKVDSSKQLGGKTASVDQAKISCNDVASGRLNSSPSVGCGFPSEESIRYRLKERRRLKKRPKTLATPAINLSSSESEFDKARTDVDLKVSRWRREIFNMSSTCSSSAVSPCTSSITSDFQSWENELSVLRAERSYFKSSTNTNLKNLPSPQRTNQTFTAESASNVSSSFESSTSASSLSSQKSFESSSQVLEGSQNAETKRASFRVKPALKSTSGEWLSKDTLVNSSIEKDSLDVSDATSVCTILDNCEPYLRDSLKDWTISFSDIKLKETFAQGSLYTVYKGQWHGDILVYLYHSINEARVPWFLKEVSRLSKIRHENICLFMGACFNNNNMAVVTSELKGMSVYERLHLTMDRMPSRARVNIARYVAQAIGYLHSRNLTVRTLSTRNIYFEPKVKLSLMDQSNNLPMNLPKRRGIFLARGVLSYFAPEFLKNLKFPSSDSDSTIEDEICTFETDSYAFGTLLYELLSCHLAMKGLTNEEMIWMICEGRKQDLSLLGCNPLLKALIEKCWSYEPQTRPSFNDINQELMQSGLHKRHSSSQPERLDHRGSFSLH